MNLCLLTPGKGNSMIHAFTRINPNAKVPALIDGDATIFDSNAILLYLAEKTGCFLPRNIPTARARMYSWLMFVASGIGPYSGQAAHFKHFAPERDGYAINRYDFEAWRHWSIIDTHLDNSRYMLGDEYTMVDMAVWGWALFVPFVLGPDAWERLPRAKRLFDEINARPAAQRANALRTRHAFKTEVDDVARAALFPQNARLYAEVGLDNLPRA